MKHCLVWWLMIYCTINCYQSLCMKWSPTYEKCNNYSNWNIKKKVFLKSTFDYNMLFDSILPVIFYNGLCCFKRRGNHISFEILRSSQLGLQWTSDNGLWFCCFSDFLYNNYFKQLEIFAMYNNHIGTTIHLLVSNNWQNWNRSFGRYIWYIFNGFWNYLCNCAHVTDINNLFKFVL